MGNKIFSVKRNGIFWSVIDCGEAKEGGMTFGNLQYFKKDGRAYRWHSPLYKPENLQDWQEIKVKEVFVAAEEGNSFEGWEDRQDGLYETLANFTTLIVGKPMTIQEVKEALKKAQKL